MLKLIFSEDTDFRLRELLAVRTQHQMNISNYTLNYLYNYLFREFAYIFQITELIFFKVSLQRMTFLLLFYLR